MDATNLFNKYPAINEFYFTTDGIAWYSDADAKRHHKTMGTPDAEVECVKRTQTAPVASIVTETVAQEKTADAPETAVEEIVTLPRLG
jgi:hypothetical protein